jgi:hypothetical protein
MPLPTAVPRKHIHTRDIQCCGYERDDGLWDIEGHLVDTKAFSTTARDTGRARQAGEPIHNMWLRLTIDLDMKIHDVEAVTDASPYQLCPTITPNFKKLIGITIGPGWRKQMLEHLGAAKGCTHLVELLGPLATTAFQATNRARENHNAANPQSAKRPFQINACHMYKEDGDWVKERWPQWYTGK